jgi:hypothetical protein
MLRGPVFPGGETTMKEGGQTMKSAFDYYRSGIACKLVGYVDRCSHPEKERRHGSASGSVPSAS